MDTHGDLGARALHGDMMLDTEQSVLSELDSLLDDLSRLQEETVESTTPRAVNKSLTATTGFRRDPGLAKIVIVDDEPINIKVVRKYLKQAGYGRFADTCNAAQALELIEQERPDLLLLDIVMPEIDGLEILARLQDSPELSQTPVLILTASGERDMKNRALKLGASDFLTKPVDAAELVARVHNVLAAKAYQDHLKGYATDLERQVQLRTMELVTSRLEVIHCLGRAAEYRDNDTGKHVIRVGRYAGIIARQLGLEPSFIELIEHAAPLHDVGKIGIPDDILLKPDKLTATEFEVMKKHCGYGKKIFEPMSADEWNAVIAHTSVGARMLQECRSPVIKLAASIALTHHEKWDGSGYPLGLAGEDIPLEGRITAVADVFDALSSKRPYKQPYPLDKCFAILDEGRGSHFDPSVLDAFFARRSDVIEVQLEFADTT